MLAACRSKNGGAEQTVLAEDYDAFFLWAGVKPPAWLKRARTVYALAGEVRHQPGSRFVGRRAVPRVSGTRLWLTVRVERLDWEQGVYRAVLREVERWAAAGNALAGLQIDSHTPHSFYIDRYPAGREATLNFGTIDLLWTNDTEAPVVVRSSASDTAVTVSIYGGNGGRRVRAETQSRTSNDQGGFDITIDRVVVAGDGTRSRDSFTTVYGLPAE